MAHPRGGTARIECVRRSVLLISCTLVLLLAGCGGRAGDGGPAVVERDTGSSGRVVATLGDSIVAGSPHWDPDPAVRNGFDEPDEQSQWQRWVDSPAQLRNCGVWGERTDEIATRYETCTEGADAVVVQGGINDIVQGRPVEDAAHDLACIAQRAADDGLDVALVDVLPWNNGHPDAAAPIRELNEAIHDLGTRAGVPVLPFFATLEDPRKPDRMPANLTVEGDHPNVDGYRMLGERAWREPVAPSGSFATDCT